MGFPLFCCYLSFFSCLLVCGCYGCLDEERRALLSIRAAFDIPGYTSLLGSWGNHGSDCCSWERVTCGSASKRVTSLDLHHARPFDSLDGTELNYTLELDYSLDATLFLPFNELHHLDLSSNSIISCLGFERLKNLSKLEFLDLSSNVLDDSIVPSLAAIASLESLSLHDNYMGSSLSIHGLEPWSKLRKLSYLDLSMNSFNETVISTLAGISSLKTLFLRNNAMAGTLPIQELSKLGLEVLDLSGNKFVGGFPALMEEWTSLKAISLSETMLNGTLPVQGLCKIKNIQELDLSGNGLTGVLPSCLGQLTSLRFFDASSNHLQINFPSSVILNLTSLEYLSLSQNQLEGILFLSSLSNHSNLKVLDLVSQNNELEVETESPAVTPSFQLEGLILSNCSLNRISGSIPSFISSQSALKWIDLSHNNLNGHIPSWLLENKTSLNFLNLQNNILTGPLILPPQPFQNASWLDVSRNKINGELPTNFGVIFPNLVYLKLRQNSFQGSVPSSFGYMRLLQYLDLANNNFSGKITDNYLTNWSSLVALQLSNNMFHGKMPGHSNLSSLAHMSLDGNQFTGEIPIDICNYYELFDLDISRNNLSGSIPNCLANLTQLLALNVEENNLEGHIPSDFCNSTELHFLDLSRNHLSGVIPPCLNQDSLKYIHLHDNGLTGSFPVALYSSPQMITIDISYNYLSGKIPRWTGGPPNNLRVLLLKGNRLEGQIPKQMCRLKHLSILDLSHNKLSGRIPSCFNIGYRGGVSDSFVYHMSDKGIEIQNSSPFYRGLLPDKPVLHDFGYNGAVQEVFITKSIKYSYQGSVLNYMSGLDLSFNNLEGDIPLEMGSMSSLHALNLSNNHLTGPIPHTFSNLKMLESLDLSHNMLSGQLPRELVQMTSLAVFSVAYNNLSGPTLGEAAQFITFNESSYKGNQYLCGFPLEKNCTSKSAALPSPLPDEDGGHGDHSNTAIDRLIFFAPFAVAFIMGFWGFMAVLYIKNGWREALFRATDWCTHECLAKFYYLLIWIQARRHKG